MQTPEQTPADPPTPPADLSRLRIERGREGRTRIGGFPWLKLTIALGVLAFVFLLREPLLALVSGSGGRAVKTGRATRVIPGQARQGDVAANGYIKADKESSLASELSGRLVELNAKEGDIVQRDAVVARIQYDDREAQEHQAQAAVASAEARLLQAGAQHESAKARVVQAEKDHEAALLHAKQLDADIAAQRDMLASAQEERDRLQREVERNRKLHEDKFINAAEWDRIQTAARAATNQLAATRQRLRALEAGRLAWDGTIATRKAGWDVARSDAEAAAQAKAVAAAGLGEAQAALRFASIMVEKTRIRAPFTGLVIRKDADVGEVIAPLGAGNSTASVVTIADPESFEVQVELSERRIGRVHEGDRAMVFLDADPDTALPGKVRKIWPRADRAKGSIELRVTLDERPAHLRPDMAARVVFKGAEAPTEAAEPFVTVPAEAIVKRRGRDVVFVLEGEVVRAVAVTRGALEGRRVAVTGELAGNEQVVLAPPAALADGDRVHIAE